MQLPPNVVLIRCWFIFHFEIIQNTMFWRSKKMKYSALISSKLKVIITISLTQIIFLSLTFFLCFFSNIAAIDSMMTSGIWSCPPVKTVLLESISQLMKLDSCRWNTSLFNNLHSFLSKWILTLFNICV